MRSRIAPPAYTRQVRPKNRPARHLPWDEGPGELRGILSFYSYFNTPPCWPPGIESELSTAGLRGFRTTRRGGPPQHRRLASSTSGVPRAAAAGRPHRSSLKQIKRRRGPSRRDFTAGAHHGGRRTRPVGSVAGRPRPSATCALGVLAGYSRGTHSTCASFACRVCRCVATVCCNGVLQRRCAAVGERGRRARVRWVLPWYRGRRREEAYRQGRNKPDCIVWSTSAWTRRAS
jgi:hypothetical protein